MRFQKSILPAICLSAGIFFSAGCGKENFTTAPQLRFVRANTYEVPRGSVFEITLRFTDKEGDIGDSLFIEARNSNCPLSNIDLRYPIPTFPTKPNLEGDIVVQYINGVTVTGFATWAGNRCGRPDSTRFRFWIKDKAKNVSDTVSVDRPIVILN